MARRGIRMGLGTLLVAALCGAVAVRLGDGNPIVATVPVGTIPVSVAVDAQSNRAFVLSSGDNSISVLDTRSGALYRTVPVGAGPTAMVVDEPDRRVFVSNTGWRVVEEAGHIVAYEALDGGSPSITILDATSGRLLRAMPADVSVQGALVDVPDRRIFVNTNDLHDEGVGLFSAAGTRAMRLTVVLGTPIAVARDDRARRIIVVGVTFDRGSIVTVLDAATGNLVQRSVVDAVFSRHPLAVDARTGRAFVVGATLAANRVLRGSLAVFDTRSGTLLRTVAFPSIPTAVAVDEQAGHVFASILGPATLSAPISNGAGTVVMLDARSGALLRVSNVGIAPGPLAVDTRRHRVLVADVGALDAAGNPAGPGAVGVLDARSGAVLRTVPVGIAPGDIAVDEQAARAFILNFGGAVRGPDSWGWLPASLRQRVPFLPRTAPGASTAPGSVTILDLSRL